MANLIYSLTLVIAGLILITFSARIADRRNRLADPEKDRLGEATPRRYILFGALLLILGLAGVAGFGPF
jgi:energy-converting hydrogenase Eha subunit H